MTTDHVDVLIVGAGLSGIGAAHHLQANCPGKTYAILESRDAIGGTWDLFRYPGIRSDSDMFTLGYSFRPWTAAKSIADGPAILDYVRDTASEGWDRPSHPLRPSRHARRLVLAGGALDRHRRAHRHRRDGGADRLLRLLLHGLLPLRRGLHAGLPGPRSVRWQADPPAALAGGLRLRRQARRRHRQRRDGRDARPRDGRDRRPRDDAPALADLHHDLARRGPDRQRGPARPAVEGRLRGRCAGRTSSPRASSST